MGRSVADATNAWRIRRMRGDTGRLRRLLLVARVCPELFREIVLPVAALLDLVAVFLAEGLAREVGEVAWGIFCCGVDS